MAMALEGLRVLEFTQVISGSYCGLMLANMGAEIIKIERPKVGEFYRSNGPKNENGIHLTYPNYNRNKKNITLNVQDPRAQEIIYDLVKTCDVVIENYRPGLLKKCHLGYDDLKKYNPSLIMCSISGYGQTGPYAKRLAFDMTVACQCGIMSVTGEPDHPVRPGISTVDFASGMYGAIGILGALNHKTRTGEGQYIDVSMMDSGMAILDAYVAEGKFRNMRFTGLGNRKANYCPLNLFQTKDGRIMISCTSQASFESLCKLMGHTELIDDPEYADNFKRKKHEPELEAMVTEWTMQYTVKDCAALLESNGIPNAVMLYPDQLMDDPQVQARHSYVEMDLPGVGKYPTPAFVPRFSTLETPNKPSCTIGEYNDYVFKDIMGFSDEKIKELEENGVI